MPMNFPTLESLSNRAKQRDFRQPKENESEETYREEFANFMQSVDFIEAEEIRNKVGWDKFSNDENSLLVMRLLLNQQAT